jgi:hypothetical protein
MPHADLLSLIGWLVIAEGSKPALEFVRCLVSVIPAAPACFGLMALWQTRAFGMAG